MTVNCVPEVIGRHVKIQIQTQFLTLCEVDVFVIPMIGERDRMKERNGERPGGFGKQLL